MLVYYFLPFIVNNRYLLFQVSSGHNSVTVQNRTHVVWTFLLRITHTIISQSSADSSWITLYYQWNRSRMVTAKLDCKEINTLRLISDAKKNKAVSHRFGRNWTSNNRDSENRQYTVLMGWGNVVFSLVWVNIVSLWLYEHHYLAFSHCRYPSLNAMRVVHPLKHSASWLYHLH